MNDLTQEVKTLSQMRDTAHMQFQKLSEAVRILERFTHKKLGRVRTTFAHRVTKPVQHNISAAGRKRIALAQKARWAKARKTSAKPVLLKKAA